jgi:hypothetical protein
VTLPCPGYPEGESLNPPAHDGGYCCWACDHGWDDARCTCFEPPTDMPDRPPSYTATIPKRQTED